MTPLPLDPARTQELARGIEQLMALNGCNLVEAITAVLALTLRHGRRMPHHERINLLDAISGALTLAAKPRLDA
jgi:hypothetical protein